MRFYSPRSTLAPAYMPLNATLFDLRLGHIKTLKDGNTKNTIAKGALINFTSQINNSNLTLFFSYRNMGKIF